MIELRGTIRNLAKWFRLCERLVDRSPRMERNTDNSARVAGGPTSTGVLTRGQMARALREGSLGEARSGGTGGGVIAGAISRVDVRKYINNKYLRTSCGGVTLAMLMAAAITVAPTLEIPGNSANVPSSGPQPAGSIPRTPGPSVGDGNSVHPYVSDVNQGHQKKMLNKITSVTAAAVVGIAATLAGAQSGAVQWKVEDGGNGHWYAGAQLPNGSSPANRWDAASLYCGERGGHLATPTSESENDFIVANAVTQIPPQSGVGRGPMLGGRLETNGWQWIDGEPWSYSGWCGSEPTGDGIHLHYWAFSNLCWNDFPGTDAITNTLIVEWSADCNNDNIIDYGQCHNGTLADYNTNNIPDCCERGETCVVGSYPVQWRAEDGGNSHWYSFNWILNTGPEGVCWPDARQRSIATGGELVSLASASEAQFLVDCFCPGPGSEFGWMGNLGWLGYQGTPVWSDGEPVTYTNWYPGQPSGDGPYVAMGCQTAWNDIGGSGGCHSSSELPLSFWVTEWSADCNNDNTVDYGQILTGQLADSNTNGVPDICEQPQCRDADITNNHIVDGADLGAMLAFWGPVNPVLLRADINRDGQVDGIDLSILLSYWGPCP